MSDLPVIQGSVLVLRGDEVLVEASSGFADAAAGKLCSARTRFQIASISKQMTAAAVLLLAERGALALDDGIDRWIGGCPSSWRQITLHHLLTHSSGLGHWPDHPMIDLTAPMDPDELLKTFAAVPPLFPVGGGWRYSSPGYVLLAHVVQRAADEPYQEFLAGRIFAPLGMDATFAGNPHGRTDLARGYAGVELIPSYELDVVGMGAGDVWSTIGDLRSWLDGLRAGRLLGGDTLDLMWSEQVSTGGGTSEGHSYGYGWFIGTFGGQLWRSHSGHNDGYKAFLGWSPGSDRQVTVLSNQEHTAPADLMAYLSAEGG